MDFLGHISFSVSDFQKSLKFYDAVLGELEHQRMYTSDSGAGWGRAVAPSEGFHLAFHANKKEEIHGFEIEIKLFV